MMERLQSNWNSQIFRMAVKNVIKDVYQNLRDNIIGNSEIPKGFSLT